MKTRLFFLVIVFTSLCMGGYAQKEPTYKKVGSDLFCGYWYVQDESSKKIGLADKYGILVIPAIYDDLVYAVRSSP